MTFLDGWKYAKDARTLGILHRGECNWGFPDLPACKRMTDLLLHRDDPFMYGFLISAGHIGIAGVLDDKNDE